MYGKINKEPAKRKKNAVREVVGNGLVVSVLS